MNLTALLAWFPLRIRAGARILFNFARTELEIIVNALLFFLLLNAGVMTLGLVIGKLGYWLSFIPWAGPWLGYTSYLGSFLIALAGAISGFLWLYVWVRIAALTVLATKGSEVLVKVIQQVSRPLPSSPIEIPLLISAESAAAFLRVVMGGFAALAGASAYAAIFPVYKNLTGFFITIILCFFIAFASYAWALEDKYHAKKWLVTAAAVLVLINTLALVIPDLVRKEVEHRLSLFTGQRTNERRLEENAQPTDAAQQHLENGLTALQNRRDAILGNLATSGELTADQQRELARVNQLIEKLSSGEPLKLRPEAARDYTKFRSDAPTWPLGLLALVVLWWVVRGKAWKTSSSSGGH